MYFLERVCDSFIGLLGYKSLRDLPRGVDEYLDLREKSLGNSVTSGESPKTQSSAAEQRQLKKDLTRLERQIEKLKEKVSSLKKEQEQQAFDSDRLLEITSELAKSEQELATREEEWLEVTVLLEA